MKLIVRIGIGSLLYGILFFLIGNIQAQVFTEPLHFNPTQYYSKLRFDQAKRKEAYLQKTTLSDTLPNAFFFDDFSRTDLSWAPSRYYFSQAIRQLYFFSPENGRGFGDNRLVIKTTDRGKVWSRKDTVIAPDILSVSFPQNDGNGWACGTNGWLAQTVDTGNTWQQKAAPFGPQKFFSVTFKTETEGLLVTDSGRIYYTNNGGINWNLGLYANNIGFTPVDVSWNGARAIAVGDNLKYAISNDGGQNWTITQRDTNNHPSFRRIKFFANGGNGMWIAAGDSGVIYKSLNNGDFWFKTLSKSSSDLLDFDFEDTTNKKMGWAVGKSGALLATQDGGNSWTQIRSGTTDDLNCVVLINEFRGWIGSSNGRIFQVVIDPIKPESKWWERNSATFINNTYCVNPVSYGVATFDGLNALGLPYSTIVGQAGPCDTLTSVHLDLSGTANNPFNISFYWQPGGKIAQVVPDRPDSLVLQLKTPEDIWVSVWNRKGLENTFSVPFRYSAILIPEEFKYRGFQFRFINYGNMNGNFDIWNLDYVRLDDQHNATDSSALDFSLITTPTRLLKDFHAYPLDQYNEQLVEGSLFSDTIKSSVINMTSVGNENNVTGRFRIISEDKEEILYENTSILGLTNTVPNKNRTQPIGFEKSKFLASPLPKLFDYTTLKYGFFLDRDPFYNLYQGNDTLYGRLNLSTYMAYDDGTAEAIRGVGLNNSKGAVRFYLPRTDTLTDIMLYFPRSPFTQVQDINFTLILYRDINLENNTEDVIFRLPVSLPQADSLNKFDYFSLRIKPISQRILEGGKDFYIGWQQSTIDNGNEVRLGCDINSSNPGAFLYNTGSGWSTWTQDNYPVMFRPVFGVETPLAVKGQLAKPKSPFFPNPAKDRIRNLETYQNLTIYNALGQLMLKDSNLKGDLEIDFQLVPGLYTLKWQEMDGQWVSQRLLVEGL